MECLFIDIYYWEANSASLFFMSFLNSNLNSVLTNG